MCAKKKVEERPVLLDGPEKLTVPLHKLEPGHMAGLRMNMLTMGEAGGVSTGSGLGSDAIWLEWKGAYYYVRGSELLKALVRNIDPSDADRFPAGIGEAEP